MNKPYPVFGVIFLALAFVGCNKGPNTQYVEGTVTLDGQPLAGASVTFVPVSEGTGETAGGFSDDNGVYRLSSLYGQGGKGALAADYVVLVSKSKTVPLAKPIKYDDGTETTETSEQILNPIYRDKTKTPLKFSVKPGRNNINLELLGKP